MKTKHTQGEWDYCPTQIDPKKHNFSIITNGGTSVIADIYRKRSWDGEKSTEDKEQSEANAKLIAAAPELLEALKMLMHPNDMNDISFELRARKMAKETIKKATE